LVPAAPSEWQHADVRVCAASRSTPNERRLGFDDSGTDQGPPRWLTDIFAEEEDEDRFVKLNNNSSFAAPYERW